MSIGYRVIEQMVGSGLSVQKTQSKTGAAHAQIEETVADSETDYEIDLDIDVSEIVACFLLSTEDVTFETNSGAAADDSISLLADQPYIWHDTDYDSCLLTTDITSVFITNSSGSEATVKMWFLYDPTP